MPTLGEELKRLREEKGLEIRDVSEATHIGSRFLQAIESDNYSILPGGIFNRGFIRSFARSVGMDEEQALNYYNRQLEAQGGETFRNATPSIDGIEEEAPSPWGTIALIVIILLILSAGVYIAYNWFKGSEATGEFVSATPALTPSPESSTLAIANETAESSPATAATPESSPTASPTESPAATITGNLVVKVQIGSEPCWLKVTIDDNQPAMGTLNPGESREFAASNKLIMSFGNAVGVTATLNGRPMKLPMKGVTSYVVLTKDNYQTFLQ